MARRIWITADTHFGEADAIPMFGRPFHDAASMDEALVEAINARVARNDLLLHLGDFCGAHPEGRRAQVAHARRIRGRIHCRRIALVRGNHDPDSGRFESLFDRIDDLRSWRMGDDRLRVNACHWPLRLWRGQFKGAVMLHGHAHGGLSTMPRCVDVGVDCWQWKPVEFSSLIAWIVRTPVERPDGWPRLQRDQDPDRLPEPPHAS
jgi:calcineurin-like phosphoesterase family protein